MVRVKTKKSPADQFCNVLKTCDLYGKSIVLNYKGEQSFKTIIGGVASLFIFIFIIVYFLIQIQAMIHYGNSNVSKNIFRKNINEDTTKHEIGSSGLTFGISLFHNKTQQILNNTSYLSYTVKQVNVNDPANFTGNYSFNSADISMTRCNETSDKVPEKTIKGKRLEQFLCPSVSNFILAGSDYAPLFDFIEISISK